MFCSPSSHLNPSSFRLAQLQHLTLVYRVPEVTSPSTSYSTATTSTFGSLFGCQEHRVVVIAFQGQSTDRKLCTDVRKTDSDSSLSCKHAHTSSVGVGIEEAHIPRSDSNESESVLWTLGPGSPLGVMTTRHSPPTLISRLQFSPHIRGNVTARIPRRQRRDPDVMHHAPPAKESLCPQSV